MSSIGKNRLVLLFNTSLESVRSRYLKHVQQSTIGSLLYQLFRQRENTDKLIIQEAFEPIHYTQIEATSSSQASASSSMMPADSNFDLVLARAAELRNTTLPDMGELTTLIQLLQQINSTSVNDERLCEAIMIELDKDVLLSKLKSIGSSKDLPFATINASNMYRFAFTLYFYTNTSQNMSLSYVAPFPDYSMATKAVGEMLRCNNTITELTLTNCCLLSNGTHDIARALADKNNLISLTLTDALIEDEGCSYIAQALINNSALVTLNLHRNEIGDEGARHIAIMLTVNKNLTALNLSDNNIGDMGVTFIANTFSDKGSSLVTLQLSNNNIGDDGAIHIADTLAANECSRLTHLDLSSNDIGDNAASHIAQMLIKNKSLTSLDLSKNNISDVGLAHITEALRSNYTLIHLNLKKNPAHNETALKIIDVLLERNRSNIKNRSCSLFSLLSEASILNEEASAVATEVNSNLVSPK